MSGKITHKKGKRGLTLPQGAKVVRGDYKLSIYNNHPNRAQRRAREAETRKEDK